MEAHAEERSEKSDRINKAFKLAAKRKKKLASKVNVEVVKAEAMTEEQANKKLTPLVTEINVRFEKIEQLEGKADDHRLAAAYRIEEAKRICAASGVRFKEWAETNLKQSYETVRKLAAIGASPNPQLALEDMRNKNKEANAKLRNKEKTKKLETKLFGPIEVLQKVKPEEALKAVKKFAHDTGLVVISETEHKELRQAEKSAQLKKAEPLTLEALKAAFSALAARDKMAFVEFATAAVGGKFVSALNGGSDSAQGEDLLAIPEMLRRTRKTA